MGRSRATCSAKARGSSQPLPGSSTSLQDYFTLADMPPGGTDKMVPDASHSCSNVFQQLISSHHKLDRAPADFLMQVPESRHPPTLTGVVSLPLLLPPWLHCVEYRLHYQSRPLHPMCSARTSRACCGWSLIPACRGKPWILHALGLHHRLSWPTWYAIPGLPHAKDQAYTESSLHICTCLPQISKAAPLKGPQLLQRCCRDSYIIFPSFLLTINISQTGGVVPIHLSAFLHLLQFGMSHGTHPSCLHTNSSLKSLWGHINYPPHIISLNSWQYLLPAPNTSLMAFIPPNYSYQGRLQAGNRGC